MPLHNLPAPQKSLGQNFLLDKNILQKMVSFIPDDHRELAVEVGTGPGSLTQVLCDKFSHVVTIEKDKRMIEWLNGEKILPENCTLIEGDALALPLGRIIKESGYEEAVLTGNLPYNISTQIVFKLCEEHEFFPFASLLFQKEVAQRITAQPSSKSYGVLSLAAQHFYQVKMEMDLSPALFRPRPKVVSSLVTFKRRDSGPFAKDYRAFLKVVKGSFSQRRKKIINSLASYLKKDKPQIETALKKAGISPNCRAEEVELERFINLADTLADAN